MSAYIYDRCSADLRLCISFVGSVRDGLISLIVLKIE